MRLNPFARPKEPSPAEVLRAVQASPALNDAFAEAYGGYDPDAGLTAAQGGSAYFRGLLDSGRDLPAYDWKRVVETAYYLADYNPLAKRAVNIRKDYTIGSGLSFAVHGDDDTATEALTKVLDRFWDDPHNKLKLKLPMRVRALSITGEQCWPVAVDDKGQVRLGYVDPAAIAHVLKDPHNGERDAAVVLERRDSEGKEIVLKAVVIDGDPDSPTFARRIGLAKGEAFAFPKAGTGGGELTGVYAGACFFWRVNSLPNAERGRSDLMAAINFMDAYEQVLMNDVDRTILQKSFAWDVTLTGAGDPQIAEWKKRHAAPPKPGTVLVHNESELWEAKNPDLHMQDATALEDQILSYVSTALEMPKTWLNGQMDVNRATASEMPEPTFMALEERQTFVQDMLTEVLAFVLDQAELAGTLARRPGVQPEPWPITVEMPELVRKDMAPAATALGSVVTAMAAAIEANVLDEQVAQEAAVLALQNLGIEVDVEEMRVRIDKAKAEREEKAAQMPYGAPGDAPPPEMAQRVAEALDETLREATRERVARVREDRLLDALIATGRRGSVRKTVERDHAGRIMAVTEEDADAV